MKPLRIVVTMVVLATLFVLGPAGLWIPDDSDAQTYLRRLSAEFRNFDFTETATAAGVPGIPIWGRTVFVPMEPSTSSTILYVTMSTTGDAHGGAASWFSCEIDKMPCNPGAGGAAGAPAGWIALLKEPAGGANANCNDGGGGPGDCHDNGIYYTWCKKVDPGTHMVDIRMASSLPGNTVFIEAAHFYIDTNGFFNQMMPSNCVPGGVSD